MPPNVQKPEQLPTPTLSALASQRSPEEPAVECGVGCAAIQCDATKLEQRVERATDPAARRKLELERAWVLGKFSVQCCRAEPKDPVCSDPAQVELLRARAFRRAGEEHSALAAELRLLDRRRFAESAVTEEVRGSLVSRAEKAERMAKKDPLAEELSGALFAAVLIRLALGEEKQALENVALFQKLFGSSSPRDWARVELAVGDQLADRQSYKKLGSRVAKIQPAIDKLGRVELTLHAKALSASAHFGTGLRPRALREVDEGVELWKKEGPALVDTLRSGSSIDAARVGEALSALGQLLFLRGEVARDKANTLHIPRYHGARDRDSIQKYLESDFRSWMQKRRALIDDAEEHYRQVLEIQPEPPPKWVVHSAARVGQMLDAFASEYEKAPVPKEIQKDPALLTLYRDALTDALTPQREAARAAFRACEGYARRFDQTDDISQQCDDWLETHPDSK